MATPPADKAPCSIEAAQPDDVPIILEMIRELAEYEKMLDECVITEELLRRSIFGERPSVEALMVRAEGEPAGYVLFFQNYSTFLGRPGLYLEDIYVRPPFRRRGIARACLRYLGRICRERDYGRLEWAALTWNELANSQYRKIGAEPLEEWRTWRLTGEKLAALADDGGAL